MIRRFRSAQSSYAGHFAEPVSGFGSVAQNAFRRRNGSYICITKPLQNGGSA